MVSGLHGVHILVATAEPDVTRLGSRTQTEKPEKKERLSVRRVGET